MDRVCGAQVSDCYSTMLLVFVGNPIAFALHVRHLPSLFLCHQNLTTSCPVYSIASHPFLHCLEQSPQPFSYSEVHCVLSATHFPLTQFWGSVQCQEQFESAHHLAEYLTTILHLSLYLAHFNLFALDSIWPEEHYYPIV